MTLLRHVFLLLVLGALLAPAPVRAGKLPPEARQALVKAQAAMEAGNPAGAAVILDQYLAFTQEAPPPDVYLMLGGAHHQTGNKDRALQAFLKGHEQYPQNMHLCLNSAVVLYETGQNGRAGEYFEKTYPLGSPPSPVVLYQAGSAFYMAEQYASAARVLGRLLSLPGKPEKDWTRLAVHAFIAAGDLKRAESVLLRLLKEMPDDTAYWELLAKINLDRQDYKDATAALEISYRLKQPSRSDLERLADLYTYVNAPLKAAATLERAYGSSPAPKDAVRIAALLATAGHFKQAVRVLDRSQGAGQVEILAEKGRLLYFARDFDQAAKILDDCLRSSPDNAAARFYRGLCAWEQKQWDTARGHFNRITKNKEYGKRATAALAALADLDNARAEADAAGN